MPSLYHTEISAAAIIATKHEINYESMLLAEDDDCEDEDDELACAGAGLGGGFKSTRELHVMKYKQAIKTKKKITGLRQYLKNTKARLNYNYGELS
jgi:hypothetical protein